MIDRDLRCPCHPAQILYKYDSEKLEPCRQKQGAVTEVKCARCKMFHYLGLINRKLQENIPQHADAVQKFYNQSTTHTGGAFKFIKEEPLDGHTKNLP